MEFYAVTGPKNPLHYLIVGYVVDEVPQVVLNYLYGVLDQAIDKVDSPDADPAVGFTQEEEEAGSVRAGVPEYYIDRGHDGDGDDRNGGVYGNDDYDYAEILACKRNKKNCKKRMKGFSKKIKKRTRAYRRQHRHAISFPTESNHNNPDDSGDSNQVKNFISGGNQGGIVGDGDKGSGGYIGNSDGLDSSDDTFVDGNLNNQNVESGGSSFNSGNENNSPGIYTDDNVNNYKPNSVNSVYSEGTLNYDTNGISVFQEGNVNNVNSNSENGIIGKNDNNGGGGIRGNNMGHGNYNVQNNNYRKSNILPSEGIKSQNQTQPITNIKKK